MPDELDFDGEDSNKFIAGTRAERRKEDPDMDKPFRERIKVIISANAGNHDKAAMDVCVFLDDVVGVRGNGWFDGDEDLLGELAREGRKIYW